MSNFARPAADALEPGDIDKHIYYDRSLSTARFAQSLSWRMALPTPIRSLTYFSIRRSFAFAIGGITNRLARVIDRTLNGFRGYDID
jgi:hypothetical protein